MKITVLGNGAALNEGLAYNAFLIDDTVLVECPPDIIASLYRENKTPSSIKEIYISHLHADHSFGFPFLILRMFYESEKTGTPLPVKVFVPEEGPRYLADILEKAFSRIHPCNQWAADNCEFVVLHESMNTGLAGYNASIFRTEHYEETRGFMLHTGAGPFFAYVPDTKWCEAVKDVFLKKPGAIMIDLGGEEDEPDPIHLRESELITNGILSENTGVMVYGTHVMRKKKSITGLIQYVRAGMEIMIDTGE